MTHQKHLPLLGLALALLLAAASSCSSYKKVAYFQDLQDAVSQFPVSNPTDITFRPGDKLSILVSSRDPQLSNLFNLTILSRNSMAMGNNNTGTITGMPGYTVDADGCIDFPVLGRVAVGGLTREAVSALVKKELVERNLLKDPVVTVEYMNLYLSVLGEVKNPGRYAITKDRVTILDALSLSGDLTILGSRYNVLVLRNEGGEQHSYRVDMRSAENVYASPAYYLQQDDIVYVEPNEVRARQSTVNGNNVLSTSFWISLASLLTSVAVLIFK